MRHTHRSPSGQFAPVPPADTSVDSLSGDPLGEHDAPGAETHYAQPVHDFRYGPVSRPIEHRPALLIDAMSGEVLDAADARDLRATVPDLRTQAHLAAVPPGDELSEFLLAGAHPGYDTVRNPPRDPANPRTLPPAARIRHGVPILPDEDE